MEGPKLNWDTLPFGSITLLYLAALACIKLGHGLQDAKQWDEEIGPALDYLRDFEPKYRLAGMLSAFYVWGDVLMRDGKLSYRH